MYSKELEELIDSVLADGVITDQERAVLRKRALACGEDPDEVMIIVDGRLAKMKKAASPAIPATEKRGNIVKCPHCGAPIEAGAVKCKECGYVFTNVKANSSAEKLANKLEVLVHASYEDESDRGEAMANIIRNFPVPTAKEDLLEFIAALSPKTKVTTSNENESAYYLPPAYDAKLKECILKAQASFPDDPQLQLLVQNATKFSSSKFIANHKSLLIIAIIAILGLGGWGLNEYKVGQAESLCKELSSKIDELPIPNKDNCEEAGAALMKIHWTGGDGYFFTGERTYRDRFIEYKQEYAKRVGQAYEQAGKEVPEAFEFPEMNLPE